MALRDVWERVRGLRERAAMERDIAEEVAFHVERETERNLAAGMPAAAARRQAWLSFGGRDRFVEAAREEHRSRVLEDLFADLRLSARSLRRSPAFTLVAVLSLALGIGANSAIFSVVNAVLLEPLPYAEPGALVRVGVRNDDQDFASAISIADVVALRDARSFAEFGAWGVQQGGFAAVVNGEVESVPGALAMAGLFRALGVPPLHGRAFVDDDHEPGAPSVVLLAHAYWQERFGGDAGVIGRALQLDGQPYTVVGVMPAGFQLPGAGQLRGSAGGAHVWVAPPMEEPEWRAPFWLRGVARLRSADDLVATRTELDRLPEIVMARYPGSAGGWSYDIEPLKDTLVRDARLTLLVLFVAVGLVLLIAAANVANLLLSRATSRRPELAVRSALGAGRGRLARQLLAESLLMASLGGVLGLALAWACVRVLPAIAPGGLPRQEEIAVDGTVLLFALGVTLLSSLAVGVLPALRAARADLIVRLREGGRTGEPMGGRGSARSALVVLEFALAVSVVVGAGLVVNSLARLQRVDSGVRMERLLTVQIAIPRSRYDEPERVAAFFDPLVERVRALPGVLAAGMGMGVPPNRLIMRNPFTPEGKVYAPGERAPVAAELIVDPGYFEALGIRPTRGRLFDETDRADSEPAIIIDETLARMYFPDVNPVGRTLTTGDPVPDAPRLRIVGVVPPVRYAGLDLLPEPTLYVPYAQNRWWRSMYLVARTRGEPLELVPAVRAAVAGLDPLVPLREISTVERLASESVADPRFRALLLGSFGAISLLLACAGIYGVLAYDVARRRRETGIRIAIGAGRGTIVGEIVASGMRLAAIGIGIGAVVAAVATRLMRGLLFEVEPLDPATFVAGVALLVVVGVAACAIPALRAARTDPMVALRAE